jgi:hypothetical protein
MPLSLLITTVGRQRIPLAYTDPVPGIRAIPDSGNDTTDNGMNSAILRYAGATIADPTTIDTSGKYPLIETDLHVRPLLFTGNATLC